MVPLPCLPITGRLRTYAEMVEHPYRSAVPRLGAGRRARSLGGVASAALAVAAAVAIVAAERRSPLRRRTQAEPARTARNLVLGALSMAVVAAAEDPVVNPVAQWAKTRRQGLTQRLPLPAWVRNGLAFLGMDYTIYLWHVLTHKVPALWRLHLVHHIDLDLDASTALRFHAAEMLVSVPYRAAQVALLGTSPRTLRAWRAFFFLSILFHHSNLRLPLRLERLLACVLTTPRMHGIHHSAVRDEADSNWSSGLSLWDHLHGTFRLDVPQQQVRVGVPAFRDPAEITLLPSLALPFVHQRNAWQEEHRRRPDAGDRT